MGGQPIGEVLVSSVFCMVNVGVNVYNFIVSTLEALDKTHSKPKLACLVGQVPIYCFFAAIYLLFSQTEWAITNPSLACLVLIPIYSLYSSR